MGKVRTVKCPLCGWSKRYGKNDFEIGKIFNGSPEDDIILIQEVGGKVKGTGKGFGGGKGSTKGKIKVLGRKNLENLDDSIKEKILEKIQEIKKKLKFNKIFLKFLFFG